MTKHVIIIMQVVITLCIASSVADAQIAEVKIKGNLAYIYDDNGRYTGKYFSLDGNASIEGYNSQFIVVLKNKMVYIYDDQGKCTGKYFSLDGNAYIKNVSRSAILVKKGNLVYYYDFDGRYTGKYTNE